MISYRTTALARYGYLSALPSHEKTELDRRWAVYSNCSNRWYRFERSVWRKETLESATNPQGSGATTPPSTAAKGGDHFSKIQHEPVIDPALLNLSQDNLDTDLAQQPEIQQSQCIRDVDEDEEDGIDMIPNDGAEFGYAADAIEAILSHVELGTVGDAMRFAQSANMSHQDYVALSSQLDELPSSIIPPTIDSPTKAAASSSSNLPEILRQTHDGDESSSTRTANDQAEMTSNQVFASNSALAVLANSILDGTDPLEVHRTIIQLPDSDKDIASYRPGHLPVNGLCPQCGQEPLADFVTKIKDKKNYKRAKSEHIRVHIENCTRNRKFQDILPVLLSRYPQSLDDTPIKRPKSISKKRSCDGKDSVLQAALYLFDHPTGSCNVGDCTYQYLSVSQAKEHLHLKHNIWIIPAKINRDQKEYIARYNGGEWSQYTARFPDPIWYYDDSAWHEDPLELVHFTSALYQRRIIDSVKDVTTFGLRTDIIVPVGMLPEDDTGHPSDNRYSIVKPSGRVVKEGFCFCCVNDPSKSWTERMLPYTGIAMFEQHTSGCLRKALKTYDTYAKAVGIDRGNEKTNKPKSKGKGKEDGDEDESDLDSSGDELPVLQNKGKGKKKEKQPKKKRGRKPRDLIHQETLLKAPPFMVIDGKLACPDIVCRKRHMSFSDTLEFVRHIVAVHHVGLHYSNPNRRAVLTLDECCFEDHNALDKFIYVSAAKATSNETQEGRRQKRAGRSAAKALGTGNPVGEEEDEMSLDDADRVRTDPVENSTPSGRKRRRRG